MLFSSVHRYLDFPAAQWNQKDENVSLVPSMIAESAHISSKGNIACIILLIIAERANNLHDLAANDHATALNESSVQLTDVLFFYSNAHTKCTAACMVNKAPVMFS